MTNAYKALRFEVHQQVATVTFDNGKRNVLDQVMRTEFAEVVGRVRRDREIRALVITGAHGHFCAGGDLNAIAALDLDTHGWRNRLHDVHDWLRDLITLDRPVIAAVDGAAAGAGFSLALAADFVLATPRTRFCMSFLKVGLVPDLGAFHTLPRAVGVQRAKEIMMSARDVDGAEALRLGIAMELHEPEQLLARAQAVASSFVHASPAALSVIKRTLAAPVHDLATAMELEASGQAVATGTDDHRAAVQRFVNKEPVSYAWPVHT